MSVKTCSQIVIKNISEIKPYENNPRQNDKTVEALCKIIPKVGFNVPLYIDKDGIIIKGHARFQAAQALGMTEIPCIISDNTEEQNKLDRISDNKISELAEWDLQDLRYELEQIDGFDITDIGFELPKDDFMEVEYAQDEFEPYSAKDFNSAKLELLQKNNAQPKVTAEEFIQQNVTPQSAVVVNKDVPSPASVATPSTPSAPAPIAKEEVKETQSDKLHNQMYDVQTPRTFIPLSTYGKGVRQQWYVKEVLNGVERKYMKAVCDCCGEEVIVFLKD